MRGYPTVTAAAAGEESAEEEEVWEEGEDVWVDASDDMGPYAEAYDEPPMQPMFELDEDDEVGEGGYSFDEGEEVLEQNGVLDLQLWGA